PALTRRLAARCPGRCSTLANMRRRSPRERRKATRIAGVIEGVEIKELVTHADERGFFRELIRKTDPFFGEGAFGQLSHSLMHPGSGKGWHYHPDQIDWWYAIGSLKVGLLDLRDGSPTHRRLDGISMGDAYGPKIVKIPPMVAHGCRALDTTHLIYVTSSV